MIPRDQKNDLGRRVSRFCTICDKNQYLNKNNEKVMAILVPRWAKKIFILGLYFGSKNLYEESVF
jgi:hypothetical protein